MTVAELGVRMSSAEFTGWMAYAEMEPFGPLREDLRTGRLAALVAQIAGSKDATPASFFPEIDPPKPVTAESRKLRLQSWAAAVNAGQKPRKVPRK